jgi:23S rRNA (adenine2503-C2)-methyltransferase
MEMPRQPDKPSILGESEASLKEQLKGWNLPAYRCQQILSSIYQGQVSDFDAFTSLPKGLRQQLAEHYTFSPTKRLLVKNPDGKTEKLLLELEDRNLIETVLIRYPQTGVGQNESRRTICVSSQVGCAYGCKFCASGLAGWKRHLSRAEIVAQFIAVREWEIERERADKDTPTPFENIVFMGMGEPLANYDAVVGAIETLNAKWGFNFGARRITISTSGLVPQIRRLADEPIQFRLAISLHGATNAVREQIMPVNRRYPLEELLPAAAYFSEKHGRMLTLEYILIEDVNDSFEQARELTKIARRLHAHVNLIPYNKVEGLPWKRPNIRRQQAFGSILKSAKVSYTIRKEKGHEIDAACGQLRLQTERERAS